MKKFIISFISVAALSFCGCGGDDPEIVPGGKDEVETPGDGDTPDPGETPGYEVGKVLPAWSEGYLDMHYINTGRGECQFMIMPDGTTLLVDAGEIDPNSTSKVPPQPNASVRPHEVDIRYIKHFMPSGRTSIDWCAPSHFHTDHIGNPKAVTASSPNGYQLSGLTAIYDEIPYDRILDRGYPTYNDDPQIPALNGAFANEWIKMVKWAVANKGAVADRFRAGEEQITMVKAKDAYPGFKIFNICANGFVWNRNSSTGKGHLVDGKAEPGNPASCGFHLTYGKFDYITCGDLTGAPQNRVANYYRDFIPKGGLDLFKAHHHLSANSWGSQMQKTSFSPRVVVCQSFSDYQPDIKLLTSIVDGKFDNNTYSWTKDIFCASPHPNTVAANAALYGNVTAYDGHIVVRVAPGGDEYYVYMLDSTNFDYKIKSIHGPYQCK